MYTLSQNMTRVSIHAALLYTAYILVHVHTLYQINLTQSCSAQSCLFLFENFVKYHRVIRQPLTSACWAHFSNFLKGFLRFFYKKKCCKIKNKGENFFKLYLYHNVYYLKYCIYLSAWHAEGKQAASLPVNPVILQNNQKFIFGRYFSVKGLSQDDTKCIFHGLLKWNLYFLHERSRFSYFFVSATQLLVTLCIFKVLFWF